jgi:hypothetical protein
MTVILSLTTELLSSDFGQRFCVGRQESRYFAISEKAIQTKVNPAGDG